MGRGQIAIEFLVILGLLSLAIIPIIFAMQWNAGNSPDRLAISKGTFSAARLAASVNSVGSIGEGARLRVQVELPNVDSVQLRAHEVVLNVQTSYGEVVILQPVDYDVSGIGLEGVKAEGTYVLDVYSDAPGKVSARLVD
ncbi:MAG: hypothetical protein V1822_00755 [Candidatus Micrarchaeota archaeon]